MTNYEPTGFDDFIASLPTPRRFPPADTRTPAEHSINAAARLALGRVLAAVCLREGRQFAMHDYNAAEQLAMIVRELELEYNSVGEIAQEVLDGEV